MQISKTNSGYHTRLLICIGFVASMGMGAENCLRGQELRPAIQVQGGFRVVRHNVLINDLLGVQQPGLVGQEGEFALGATLKTDPDLESILETAARYQADGNWDVASQLWQAVLERSNDTLVSTDGKTYRSMMEQVERILATLPAEGLAVYRINADANSREILARADDEWNQQALSEITVRYFPSSIGDEAAFRLACLLMDQHEFVGAQRILEKILYLHPDPNVDPVAVVTRLALCSFVNGNADLAGKLLAANPVAASSMAGKAVFGLLSGSEEGSRAALMQMTGNSFSGLRVQPSLPEPALQKDLVATWQFCVDPASSYNKKDVAGRITLAKPDAPAEFAAKNANSLEQSFHKDWWKNNWRPTGQALFHNGQIIVKSPANLMAWSIEPGFDPAWVSAWLNKFEPDVTLMTIRAAQGGKVRDVIANQRGQMLEQPGDEISLQLFSDDVHATTCVSHNRIYSIEGPSYSVSSTPRGQNIRNQGFQWGVHTNRTRNNWLACYDATTGLALWKIPEAEKKVTGNRNPVPENAGPAEQTEKEFTGGGFMGAPIVAGSMVFAPVNHGGAIYAYCFDADRNGQLVWKTYLCDEPESGARTWTPITITSDGSDLFVGSGMGVVFCLDRATGNVRFGQRYVRDGSQNVMAMRNNFQPNSLNFEGWDEDLIIPWGGEMICLPSDASVVFSIDRRSGDVLWSAGSKPLGEPLTYVLGIHNRVLYAAGKSTIVAFDLDGQGRMLWGGEPMFGNGVSYGRGILTNDGIYMPVGSSVWKYALEPDSSSPLPVAQSSVNLGMNSPVGNLTSDGQHLWVQNGNRLFRLEPVADGERARTSATEPGPHQDSTVSSLLRTETD